MTGPYVWLDPADARFVLEARAALRLERKAWEICHASRMKMAEALKEASPGWKGRMIADQFELGYQLVRRGIHFTGQGEAGAVATVIAELDKAHARIKELEAR